MEGRRKPHGMYQAVVDDSARPGVFVLASLVTTAEIWTEISADWKRVLQEGKPLTHFKMQDFLKGNGVFSSFNEEERITKFKNLQKTLNRSNVFAYAAVLDTAEYSSIATGRVSKTLDTPFYFTSWRLTSSILRGLWRHRIKDTVEFIYDEGSSAYFKEIADQWRQIRNSPVTSLHFKWRMGDDPIERNDESFIPLQAADMLAGHVRKFHADYVLKKSSSPATPEHPFPLNITTIELRRDFISSAFNEFMMNKPPELPYEVGKTRSKRLTNKA